MLRFGLRRSRPCSSSPALLWSYSCIKEILSKTNLILVKYPSQSSLACTAKVFSFDSMWGIKIFYFILFDLILCWATTSWIDNEKKNSGKETKNISRVIVCRTLEAIGFKWRAGWRGRLREMFCLICSSRLQFSHPARLLTCSRCCFTSWLSHWTSDCSTSWCFTWAGLGSHVSVFFRISFTLLHFRLSIGHHRLLICEMF